MKIQEILFKKAQIKELAHFYIVETNAPENLAHETLLAFVHGFIRDYYQKIEGHKQSLVHLMDHPDVYVLGSLELNEDEKEEKPFKVEEAQALHRFFEFKSVQGARKFAVITQGHRINALVANKWLKLLEEPQGNSTIFLLNPRGGKLLPTIHSRAIHLRLPAQLEARNFTVWNEFIQNVKQMSLAQFLETYSRGERDLGFWVHELICWESEQIDRPSPKMALETWLKAYEEMETFHQPGATKWSLFYHFLREQVLPRIP